MKKKILMENGSPGVDPEWCFKEGSHAILGPQFSIEIHVKLRSPLARSDLLNLNPRVVVLAYDFHFSLRGGQEPAFALMNISFGLNLA